MVFNKKTYSKNVYDIVKTLYFTGKTEPEIKNIVMINSYKLRQIISEIVSELRETNGNRLLQIKNMEQYLFMCIEQEKKTKVKNKQLDSFIHAYSTFLL